jgi:glycine betaine/choline ABC-type transport system substrate-binding protein
VNAFPDDPAAARAEMTALNAKVDVELMEPEEAAQQWLEDKGLL